MDIEILDLVKKGWEDAAASYRRTKDESLIHLPIVQQWLSLGMLLLLCDQEILFIEMKYLC